ncbi:unnamed protein product [Ixodes pacificus]
MTAPGGGGFSFGTPQTQASPFGTAFGGQPVQTSATGMQSAFGAAAPTGGVQPFSFGATPTATVAPTVIAQPFSFGTPATQTETLYLLFSTFLGTCTSSALSAVSFFFISAGVSQPFGFGMAATRPQTGAAPFYSFHISLSGGFSFGSTQPTTTQAVAATQQSTFGGLGSAAAPTASVAPFFSGFGATATPAASTVPAFGSFGSVPAATSSAAPTGFGGFGTSTAVAPTSFGGFGVPAPTPASTAPTGFGGFGTLPAAATSAAPVGFGGFGAATSVATTTTTSAAPFGGFGLSSGVTITPVASSAPSTGFGTAAPASVFGAAPTSSFSALTTPATTAVTPFAGGFGVPTATTATSVVGFGMPAATAAAAVSSAVTLGTGTAMPFGSTPAVSTGFGGFGVAPQATATAATTAAVTQSSATTTAAVTTGTATTTVAAVATTTAASVFGSLGAASTPTTAATTVPSFAGLGATTTTPLATVASTASATTTATTATATTTSATSLFGGIPFKTGAPGLPGFGQTTTTTSTGLSLGSLSATSATGFGQTTTASVAAPVSSTTTGLGGVDILPASSLPGRSRFSLDFDKAVKEACLPNEISQTVDAFKKYVTEQKEIREEISRVSSRTIAKVQEETGALRQLLSAVESGVQRNGVSVERLKRETSEDLKHAEIAHHTKETPVALQYENTAPTLYFQKLVTSFGQQMKLYKQQIEELEQHFASLSSTSVLTPEDLITMVNKLHQTFTFLAAQLYSLHEAVQVSFGGLT